MISQDMKEIITQRAKYYKYDPSDMITHVQYVEQTQAAFQVHRP